MLRAIIDAIIEWREQKQKARDVLGELAIPQAVGRCSYDRMGVPGRRRAARWAEAGCFGKK